MKTEGTARVRWRVLATLLVSILAIASATCAQGPQDPSKDLTGESLEDLMNIEVTSVARREQKLSRAAAAVYVITQDDIQRSGATNIPDLLRLAPGVEVAQIDANVWAITIRGFNARYSDKVLMLIDGRPLHTPSFSGVYWDQQDLPLEDIERIEVIRGPGGTAWGTNAMNGVINIITRSSKNTQGGLVSAGTGSRETAQGLAQYGGKAGPKGTYRIFEKYFNISSSEFADDTRAADGWNSLRGGFRSDWNLSPRDSLTVEGELYRNGAGQTLTTVLDSDLPQVRTFNDQITATGGDIMGRWNRTLAGGSDMSLQVSYTRFDRLDQALVEILNAVDIDFQDHLKIGSRHDVVWGVGSRITNDGFSPGYDTTFVPRVRTNNLYSAFVQDEMRLSNSVWFTLGSKFEHNDYSGFEYEPSAQLVWTPSDRQAVWLSVARAIRQPSLEDADIVLDEAIVPVPGGFGVIEAHGDPNLRAAQLVDYEGGYRVQASGRVSLDLAVFQSFYRDLETGEPGAPFQVSSPPPAHTVYPFYFRNRAHARTYGVEASVNWDVTRRWRISPGMQLMHFDVLRDPSSQDPTAEASDGDSPRRQFQIRSSLGLPRHIDWDTALYSVSNLDNVPAYKRVDTRLSWRAGESVELSLVGQNLLAPRHLEFGDGLEVNPVPVERSFYGKITWRF